MSCAAVSKQNHPSPEPWKARLVIDQANSAPNKPIPAQTFHVSDDSSAAWKLCRKKGIWKVFGSVFKVPGNGHLSRFSKDCVCTERGKCS